MWGSPAIRDKARVRQRARVFSQLLPPLVSCRIARVHSLLERLEDFASVDPTSLPDESCCDLTAVVRFDGSSNSGTKYTHCLFSEHYSRRSACLMAPFLRLPHWLRIDKGLLYRTWRRKRNAHVVPDVLQIISPAAMIPSFFFFRSSFAQDVYNDRVKDAWDQNTEKLFDERCVGT